MKAFNLRAAVLVAGLALTAAPALAQDKAGPGGGGDRGGGNGGGSVNAGAGSGGGGGSVVGGGLSGGGGSVSSSSGGYSSPSVSGFGPSSSYRGGDGGMRMAAPEHRTSFSYSSDSAQRHPTSSTGSSSSGAQQATPRASGGTPSSGSSGSNGGNAASNRSGERTGASHRPDNTNGGGTATRPQGDDSRAVARSSGSIEAATNNPGGNREVPSWSRARGDRPVTGTAVPRSPNNPPPGRGGNGGRYGSYDPFYYDPYGFYGFYEFGGGYYGFYNPYYSPYGFGGYGLDPGFGFPYYGDPTDPYAYGAGYGSYSNRVYSGQGQGALKLKVKPRDAKVYVDGYYVGLVNQFDGMLQKLSLNGGSHKVEVKADGYETAEFDVLITPGQTLTFAGDLKKLQ